MIDVLVSTGELFGALAAVLGLVMVHPRTRRVAIATLRFGKSYMPKWALAVFGACLLVPGPADEMVVLPILVAITLRTKRNRSIYRRYLNVAWNGAS